MRFVRVILWTLLFFVCYQTVNDCIAAPILVIADTPTDYCGHSHCQPIAPNLAVIDSENEEIEGARAYFNTGYINGQDVLQFTPQYGITGTFNTATGILTLAGKATTLQYQEVLQSVCYQNTSTSPTMGQREIYFVLGDVVYFPVNGHYYKLVNKESGITWKEALDTAGKSTYFGMQGYLVNITSQQEHDFLLQLIQSNTWIGGTDEWEEGIWRWVTGCEGLEDGGKGRHFFTDDPGCDHPGGGEPVNGQFNAWDLTIPPFLQPDNDACNEHYMHFVYNRGGGWNDLPNDVGDGIRFYVVEYGCMPGDPVLQTTGYVVIDVMTSFNQIVDASICQGEYYTLPSGKNVNADGVYIDTLFTTNGCTSIVHLNLSVLAKSLSEETRTICPGEIIYWNAQEIQQEGLYQEVFTSIADCDSVAQLSVIVSDTCWSDDCYLLFPNVFTPNGDGINDVFRPIYNCEVENYLLEIYNRWGILVFTSTDPNLGWNGLSKNEIVQDNYVYYATYSVNGNRRSEKGFVVVVR